jgi:hypothetical protein
MLKSLWPEGKNILKSIVLAVLTSLIGATLIYFLGFNKKKPVYTLLERGEITADAWKTYTSVENIYVQSTISLIRDALQFGQLNIITTESAVEAEKFRNSLDGLVATDGVDEDLKDFLSRRIKTEKEQEEQTEKFYKSFGPEKSEWASYSTADTLRGRFTGFLEKTKSRFFSFAPEIEKLSQSLSETYDQPFAINDMLLMQAAKYKKGIFNLNEKTDLPPDQSASRGQNAGSAGSSGALAATKEYLAGSWDAGSGSRIQLNSNGKLSWLIAGNKEARGTWSLKNNQLIMDIDHHPVSGRSAKWVFNITNIKTDSFTIILDATQAKTYHLVRS